MPREIGAFSALPHSSTIRPFGLLGRGSLPVESLCRVARCFVHATSSRTNEWMWSGGFGKPSTPRKPAVSFERFHCVRDLSAHPGIGPHGEDEFRLNFRARQTQLAQGQSGVEDRSVAVPGQ